MVYWTCRNKNRANRGIRRTEDFEKEGQMKNCELCNSLAKLYCESDQALLCWDCDSKVHGANFLVTKHSRTLLCHLCQSPTPWIGSGPILSRTISVCHNCVNHGGKKNNGERNNDTVGEDDVTEGDDSNDDLDEDDDGDEEEDVEENQVVPWSSKPVPVSSGSSTSEESSTEICCSRANSSQSRTRSTAPDSPDRERGFSFPPEQGDVKWTSATCSPFTDNKGTK